ncbi:unnamed protein product [Diabrotica balteata]|uniref:Uncharacterized protein n=1 Tax=Diabrotica balteata TaxID=107213 RepID=A0A9N9T030_DIABA|nr:unnamed protein product [Diabrotica balteata]
MGISATEVKLLILPFLLSIGLCDVQFLIPEEHTPPPPPKPYAFGYAAGRFPGHIDRTHSEVSDGSGLVQDQLPSDTLTSPTHNLFFITYYPWRPPGKPTIHFKKLELTNYLISYIHPSNLSLYTPISPLSKFSANQKFAYHSPHKIRNTSKLS